MFRFGCGAIVAGLLVVVQAPAPATGELAYNRANPQLFAMFDIPGARERHAGPISFDAVRGLR